MEPDWHDEKDVWLNLDEDSTRTRKKTRITQCEYYSRKMFDRDEYFNYLSLLSFYQQRLDFGYANMEENRF